MATTSNAAVRPSDVEYIGKLLRARSLLHVKESELIEHHGETANESKSAGSEVSVRA
jgi:hypothetical protein